MNLIRPLINRSSAWGRMKTETQIAKENIKTSERYENNVVAGFAPHMVCKTHKASCQRFLEFLEVILEDKKIREGYMGKFINDRKIQDLKQAIRLYDRVGI